MKGEESLMEAIDIAMDAAHKAGDLIARQFHQPQEIHAKGPAEIVTQVDRDAEDLIVRTIRQAFPDDEFLGEEGHEPRPGADRIWVIDPLDGTTNYAQGIPFFCVSIALAVRGRAVLGVVYDPQHGETFAAEEGKGALLNGVEVHCTSRNSLSDATVYVGALPAKNPHNRELALPMLTRLRPSINVMRNMGSAALSLAYVACGRLDISYQDWLSAWDMLAGALLVEEAGGRVTDFDGMPISASSESIIAAGNSAVHQAVLEVAQQLLKERGLRCS